MSASSARYDCDLQMFVEVPRELNPDHLLFLRWLAEQGQLEHAIAGPPAGPLALKGASDAVPDSA